MAYTNSFNVNSKYITYVLHYTECFHVSRHFNTFLTVVIRTIKTYGFGFGLSISTDETGAVGVQLNSFITFMV